MRERGGGELEEAVVEGGTRHRLLSAPLERTGQSPCAELKLTSQSPERRSTHREVSNTKLFLDLFEGTPAARKGNSDPTWGTVATATERAR